ncbi:leucyl/phenylalanyl-tRNA--protein transferase [Alkalimonas collagenimarina]|uniref:Leucyl/phenylalanyl-tRNA--protein transferase n=1 Tax=Alkalimonas collagenimarina TaxID=400390 RepID=A0ABT9GWE3_9GAMM|nr:leucyl/phenylalanyl-tRNA--protein transferase [Alkalimonas collagenimarina]MDP4535381.1 leucyl/phenylalanyl-tRNA--protein transferase [Alkalimonas collagenimarina]
MPIYLPELTQQLNFPPVEQALRQPDGLLALGGDLKPERLLLAYQQGIFPWFSEGDPLLWWSPSVRALFAPHQLQLNRTLRKQCRKAQYRFSINTAFEQVISQCAAPRARQADTWILPPMRQAYRQLHQQGYAHSVELWQQDQLVGGLYGLMIGRLFCGESMFNRQPNTARLALIALQQHLQCHQAGWIDCQMPNDFLDQLGVCHFPRTQYLALLQELASQPCSDQTWLPQNIKLSGYE